MRHFLAVFCLWFLSASACASEDNWVLLQESALTFTTIKKQQVIETHHFSRLTGEVNEKGEVFVQIDLESLDTGIEIRNQRMNKHLFEIAKFPKLEIRTKLEKKQLTKASTTNLKKTIPVESMKVDAQITLHGKTIYKALDLSVYRLENGSVMVSTTKPVFIHASDFGITEGVRILSKLAGGIDISPSVVVGAQFFFQKH